MNDRLAWKMKRIEKRIKQKDVAAYLGCSNALLSLYENEKESMSADKVASYKNYIQSND